MYTGTICHNSIMGDHINFILGDNMRTTLQRVRDNMVAMATLVA